VVNRLRAKRIETGAVKDATRIRGEKDVERLRAMAMLLAQENERLIANVLELQKRLSVAEGRDRKQLELELAALQQQLEARTEKVFKHTSEKRPREDGNDAGGDETPKQKGHGPREQLKLRVEEVVHKLDEADMPCPCCGERLVEIEGETEDSDEIDELQREFVVRRHKKQKYRCAKGCHVTTANAPKRWFEGGRYGLGFAIGVAIAKYVDHLPLERQCRQMARLGLDVDSQTLFDQLFALETILRPAYLRLGELQRQRLLLFVDETTWPVHEKSKGVDASKWHLWTAVSPIGVYYEIHDNRGADGAKSILEGFAGHVMCDGFGAYESVAKAFPSIKLLQCWVHARRGYVECETAFPKECAEIIGLIAKLYETEARGRDRPDEERLRLRQTESKKVTSEIERWAMRTIAEGPAIPGTALRDAIDYMMRRWKRLIAFLDDARLPLDNNAAERAIRGPVVGRKNHYGSRSLRGTQVAATLYSVLESCKLVGADPRAYIEIAVHASMDGREVPLPHEVAAELASAAPADLI
jgi:transposase